MEDRIEWYLLPSRSEVVAFGNGFRLGYNCGPCRFSRRHFPFLYYGGSSIYVLDSVEHSRSKHVNTDIEAESSCSVTPLFLSTRDAPSVCTEPKSTNHYVLRTLKPVSSPVGLRQFSVILLRRRRGWKLGMGKTGCRLEWEDLFSSLFSFPFFFLI